MNPVHDDLARRVAAFAEHVTAGDLAALEACYEPGAVLVPQPGMPLVGADRTDALRHMMSLGLVMRADLRHVYSAGEFALAVVDWSMRGTAPDGRSVALSGTATDVLRRGPDGWRYVIDNPSGGA